MTLVYTSNVFMDSPAVMQSSHSRLHVTRLHKTNSDVYEAIKKDVFALPFFKYPFLVLHLLVRYSLPDNTFNMTVIPTREMKS